MRVVQTMIPHDKHDAVVRTLREEGLDFAMADETSNSAYSDISLHPDRERGVGHVLQRLRDVGIERHGYMVVSEAEAIVSDRFEAWSADDTEPTDRRISRDELRTKARNRTASSRRRLPPRPLQCVRSRSCPTLLPRGLNTRGAAATAKGNLYTPGVTSPEICNDAQRQCMGRSSRSSRSVRGPSARSVSSPTGRGFCGSA